MISQIIHRGLFEESYLIRLVFTSRGQRAIWGSLGFFLNLCPTMKVSVNHTRPGLKLRANL